MIGKLNTMFNNKNRSEYKVIPGNDYPNRLETDQSNKSKATSTFNFFKSLFNNVPVKEEPSAETSQILKK